MLSKLRIRSLQSPEPNGHHRPAGAVSGDAVAAALENIIAGQPEASALVDGPAGLALRRLANMLRNERQAQLALTVGFVADTAATGAHVGWITHDIQEVAGDSTKIAGSVEELARTIAEISKSSAEVAQEMTAMGREVHQGVERMQGAGEAMGLINESVRSMNDRLTVLESAVVQIADMAKMIESISSQTNLLALNATIEAARAGEAGRGFAVVAGEVKSLSGQTARATEQIRERIATLTAETSSIRQAIRRSTDTVASGEDAVKAAQLQMAQIGDQMGHVSIQVSELATGLANQQPVTDQIAKSTARIADKAQKVRGEIDGVIDRLTKAETAAWGATQSFDAAKIESYELLRAKGELSIWERKLAAALVGLTKPDPKLAELGPRRLLRWCETVSDDKIRNGPAVAAIRAAANAAHAQARRMIERLVGKDWSAATAAYVEAEKAIAAVIAQAGRLAEIAHAGDDPQAH
jgi:Methyl-accepting chemotaxis protein (MCP) signalling domain